MMNQTPLLRYLHFIGWTQRDLAKALGVYDTKVSRMVRGRCLAPDAAAAIRVLPPCEGFDERHIMLPTVEPYASWQPPA